MRPTQMVNLAGTGGHRLRTAKHVFWPGGLLAPEGFAAGAAAFGDRASAVQDDVSAGAARTGSSGGGKRSAQYGRRTTRWRYSKIGA